MHVIVSGKNIDLTPSLQTYAEEKLGRLEHFWSDIIRVHVELEKNKHHKHGDVCVVSVRIEIPGNDIRARQESSDMHSAIDVIATKLERQVIKAKERLRN
ncbi:MAG: ribosome-associated translation inhibitor RaiA [Candidatus Kerfeldbacteria bacterium]|nr:ribosome-associated translation inhibitor RaiA [Candidatus Kerfeldbacteria bacterium]